MDQKETTAPVALVFAGGRDELKIERKDMPIKIIKAGDITNGHITTDVKLVDPATIAPNFYEPCAQAPYFGAGEADDDHEHNWCWETGKPGIAMFAGALQVWSVMQEVRMALVDAAAAFNVPTAMIREAVEWHTWMFVETIDGVDYIGHEGE
jgi:hypothetical protein